MAKEYRDVNIEECDGGGYIISLDWKYIDRKDNVGPQERKVVADNLAEAINIAERFLTMDVELALEEAK